MHPITHFKSLILEYFFDGHEFTRLDKLRLEHDTEGAVADDLGVHVGNLLRAVRSLPSCRHHRCDFIAILACASTHKQKYIEHIEQ